MCYKKKTFILLLFLNRLTNKNTCRRIQSFTEFFFYGPFKIFYIFLHSFFLINFKFYYKNAFLKYNRLSINFVPSFPFLWLQHPPNNQVLIIYPIWTPLFYWHILWRKKHFTLNIYLQTQLLTIYRKLLNIQFLKGGIYEI